MAYVAKVIKDFNIEFHAGEILPSDLLQYLTRTGKIATLMSMEVIEVGRES
jgi:hypothetical protein